jgi:hypothetical protein
VSAKSRDRTALLVLLMVYAALAAALWVVAFDMTADKSRAAMIGAASAFTAAGAAVAGAGFNAARSSALQARRDLDQTRRLTFASLLTALRELQIACTDAAYYFAKSSDTHASQDARELAEEKLLIALNDAGAKRLALAQVYDSARLVSTSGTQAEALSFIGPLLTSTDITSITVDDSQVSALIERVRRDLGIHD